MQMYQLYNLDFTQYAILMNGKRSLIDIHHHAMKTLPNFSDMVYLHGNDYAFTAEMENKQLREQYVDETMDMTCKEYNIWNEKLSQDIFGQVNEVEDALTLSQFMGPEKTQLPLPIAIIEDDVCMSPAVPVDQLIPSSFDDTFDSEVDIARIFH